MPALVMPSPPDEPLWLDGPTGTQLESLHFVSHPGLWTAMAVQSAPTLLAGVHRSYLEAGAHCLTANTFRTTAYAAAQAGVPIAQARHWAEESVALARRVADEFPALRYVLGSLAPLADCYQPQRTPADLIVEREHARTAEWLLAAGCDGLLLESQGCGREVRLALAAVRRCYTGAVLVSLLPDETSERLLDGTDLVDTARACVDLGATALLVNCAHADVALHALQTLRRVPSLNSARIRMGAYPNAARLLRRGSRLEFEPDADSRSLLPERSQRLWQAGARILGLCCGYGPADLAQLIAALANPPPRADF